jgi:hypothetical protein
MIKIREKDVLFIAINVVLFLGFFSYTTMSWATLFAATPSPVPTIAEGYAYVCYILSKTSIIIAGMIVLFVDIWWLYRDIRKYQKGYWRENL